MSEELSSEEMLNKIKTGRAEIVELGKKLIHKGLSEFFAAQPDIYSVAWAQYIPSFNDGDPCVFSIDGPRYRLFDPEEDITSECVEDLDIHDFNHYTEDEQLKTSLNKLDEILSAIEPSSLEGIFGEGVLVKATRDKIYTDEYCD